VAAHPPNARKLRNVPPVKSRATRSTIGRCAVCITEIVFAFWILYACLIAVDLPLMDVHGDHALKTLRYPDMDNVYRGEGYSRYRINSYGLLGREPAPLSDSSVFRIAVFGDSFVEALQVPHAVKFTTLLERSLVPSAGKTKAEVWNFGYSADNTGNAFARWQQSRKYVQFDLVVFSFNDGDLVENRLKDARNKLGSFLVEDGSNRFRLVQAEGFGGSLLPWLNATFPRFHNFHYQVRDRATSYLTTAKAAVADRLRGMGATPAQAMQHNIIPISNEQLDSTLRQLEFVHNQIADTGTRILLLGIPTDAATPAGFGSHRDDALNGYLALIRGLKEHSMPIIDPYPAIESEIAAGKDPYSDWEPFRHYNARGHRLIATAVVAYIAKHPTLSVQVRDEAIQEASR